MRVILILMLALISSPSNSKDYEVSKITESQAELNCRILAGIQLHHQDFSNLAIYSKPKITGVAIAGKKHVAVVYPYRNDGVSYICLFKNFTLGRLQLIEFGHASSDGPAKTTVTNLLY